MAKKKFLLGILTVMMLFGFKISCEADDGGTLVITNIPAKFNGKFVDLQGESRSEFVLGLQSMDPPTRARVSNGKVENPLWLPIDKGRNNQYVRYAGNGYFEFMIFLYDSPARDDMRASFDFDFVRVSNGSATVSFRDADDFWEK